MIFFVFYRYFDKKQLHKILVKWLRLFEWKNSVTIEINKNNKSKYLIFVYRF